MEKSEKIANDIISRRGIYYQAFGIYKEISGFYDYGPIGLRIRRNIENTWRRFFLGELNAMEVETTLVLPEVVLKASGHLSTFTDPIIDCTVCNASHRADKLLEEFYEKKGDTKSFSAVKRMNISELEKEIFSSGVKCPKCGSKLSKIESFNLMFKTQIGPGSSENGYLRPETAQGIFVDFKNLFRVYGLKLPVCISQAGKVFRNEISPRQQLSRMREFGQMETEFFFDPGTDLEEFNGIWFDTFAKAEITFVESNSDEVKERRIGELLDLRIIPNRHLALLIYLEDKLMAKMGLSKEMYRFRQVEKEELPHYSQGNIDLEAKTEYGWMEVAGNASRSDFDLSQHAKLSGEELGVVLDGKRILPHVAEASIGIDRLLLSILHNSAVDGSERGWSYLKLNENISPYHFAIFPLQKDEKLMDKARDVYYLLNERNVSSYYSEAGGIGKRYAKADEIGVLSCITIDYQTLEDDTVTIRDRDTTKQVRKKIGELF